MANAPKSTKSATSSGAAGSSGGGPFTKDLEADIQRLREDIAKLTKDLQSAGETTLKNARKAASAKAEGWRAEGESKVSELREGARDMEQEVERRVREKPMTSLAMAVGVGYFLALLTRR